LLCLRAGQPQADSLEKLADDFWAWRAKYAPFTGDDVNRMERPGGMRDWSHASIETRRKDLAGFEARWKKIDATHWPISRQVDYKLIRSALSRVRWELDINPRWKRDPNFYIEQTLTPIAEAFLIPGPYNAAQSKEILARIENIPSILQQGTANLDKPPAPFATVAIQALAGVRERLRKMSKALPGSTMLKEADLNGAVERAAEALEKYQGALQEKLPSFPQQTSLGRDAYLFFLKDVALYPYSPEELLAMTAPWRSKRPRRIGTKLFRHSNSPITSTIGSKTRPEKNYRSANFSTNGAFSPSPIGSSTSSYVRCPNIFVRSKTSPRWLISHRHRVCKTTVAGM